MSLHLALDPSGSHAPLPVLISPDSYQSGPLSMASPGFESFSGGQAAQNSGYTFRPTELHPVPAFPVDSGYWAPNQAPFGGFGPLPLHSGWSGNNNHEILPNPQGFERKKRIYKPIKPNRNPNHELLIEFVLDKILPAYPELGAQTSYGQQSYPFSEDQVPYPDLSGQHMYPPQNNMFGSHYQQGIPIEHGVFHPNQQIIPINTEFGVIPHPIIPGPDQVFASTPHLEMNMFHHNGMIPLDVHPVPHMPVDPSGHNPFGMLHSDPGFQYGQLGVHMYPVDFNIQPQYGNPSFGPDYTCGLPMMPTVPFPIEPYPLPGLPLAPGSGEPVAHMRVSNPKIHVIGAGGCKTFRPVPKPLFGTGLPKNPSDNQDLNTFLHLMERDGYQAPSQLPLLFSASRTLRINRKYTRIRPTGFMQKLQDVDLRMAIAPATVECESDDQPMEHPINSDQLPKVLPQHRTSLSGHLPVLPPQMAHNLASLSGHEGLPDSSDDLSRMKSDRKVQVEPARSGHYHNSGEINHDVSHEKFVDKESNKKEKKDKERKEKKEKKEKKSKKDKKEKKEKHNKPEKKEKDHSASHDRMVETPLKAEKETEMPIQEPETDFKPSENTPRYSVKTNPDAQSPKLDTESQVSSAKKPMFLIKKKPGLEGMRKIKVSKKEGSPPKGSKADLLQADGIKMSYEKYLQQIVGSPDLQEFYEVKNEERQLRLREYFMRKAAAHKRQIELRKSKEVARKQPPKPVWQPEESIFERPSQVARPNNLLGLKSVSLMFDGKSHEQYYRDKYFQEMFGMECPPDFMANKQLPLLVRPTPIGGSMKTRPAKSRNALNSTNISIEEPIVMKHNPRQHQNPRGENSTVQRYRYFHQDIQGVNYLVPQPPVRFPSLPPRTLKQPGSLKL